VKQPALPTRTQTCKLKDTLSLTHTVGGAASVTHTHTHMHTHFLSLSFSHAHTHAHTLSHTHSLPVKRPALPIYIQLCTHTLSLTHTHADGGAASDGRDQGGVHARKANGRQRIRRWTSQK